MNRSHVIILSFDCVIEGISANMVYTANYCCKNEEGDEIEVYRHAPLLRFTYGYHISEHFNEKQLRIGLDIGFIV